MTYKIIFSFFQDDILQTLDREGDGAEILRISVINKRRKPTTLDDETNKQTCAFMCLDDRKLLLLLRE